MKLFLIIGVLSLFSIISGCGAQNKTVAADAPRTNSEIESKNEPAKNKTPVLVELFTSEGCSDCPPADGVLARLEREQPNSDAEIITLALHVDYWDRLGWKDQFSSHFYSERQNEYGEKFKLNSIYTPQMVVDGQKEFVGSNFQNAQTAVGEAAKNQKATIEISKGADRENSKLKVKISNLPARENSDVWLAIAEDDLQTNVERGENRDKILSHTSVARELKSIGNINANDKVFEVETAYQLQPGWNKKNLNFVVFVQGKETKNIYGVNKKSVE